MTFARLLLAAAMVAVAFAACPFNGLTLPDSGSESGFIGSDADYHGTGQYVDSESCSWTIDCAGHLNGQVHIDYVTGSLENGFDFLTVGGQTLTGTFDRSDLIAAIGQVTSLTVEFVSDVSTTDNGFLLRYSCVPTDTQFVPSTCDYNSVDHYTLAEGHIFVPGPEYNINQVCDWLVECPSGTEFTIESLTGATEPGYDFVSISGPTISERLFSGAINVENERLSNSPNTVVVRFNSDYGTNDVGFDLYYRCTRCTAPTDGQAFGGLSGVIDSDTDGSGSALYSSNEHCEWFIGCPANTRLRAVLSGETESNFDKVSLISQDYSTTYSVHSGSFTRDYIWPSGSNSAIIRFKSDGSAEFPGFSLSYACIDNTYCCSSAMTYCTTLQSYCSQLDCTVLNGLAGSDSYFQPLADACNGASTQCGDMAYNCFGFVDGCI